MSWPVMRHAFGARRCAEHAHPYPAPASWGLPTCGCPGYFVFVPFAAPCHDEWERSIPVEIDVQSGATSSPTMVGGREEVRFVLEYLVDPKSAPGSVTLTIANPDGSSSSWSDTSAAAGYHRNDRLPPARPGASVTLATTGAAARLRWCETICC